MSKIHIIMPMGGKGHRFAKEGFATPKPLIEIHEKPFFYWAVESLRKFITNYDLTFVVLKEHVRNFQIDKKIKKFYPDAHIVIIPEVLNGAVLTCMEGVKEIHDEEPIIFNDCDHLFCSKDFNEFCKEINPNINGGLLTFESNDPKFSYVKLENGKVLETAEKKVLSNEAICGAYYFQNKETFLKNANEYLEKCNYNEYYVSGVYNVMIEHGACIKTFKTDYHLAFGTPEEYENAKESEYFEELI